MQLNKLIVKKAAVLGAGVMGAQIAAHLANANVPVVLFDLPAKEGDKDLRCPNTRTCPPRKATRTGSSIRPSTG